jgi:hypothetical protein
VPVPERIVSAARDAREQAWGVYRDGPDYQPTDRVGAREYFDAGWDAATAVPAPLVVDKEAVRALMREHKLFRYQSRRKYGQGFSFDTDSEDAFVDALLSSGVVEERASEYGLMFRSHYDQDSWTPRATVMPREKAEQHAAESSGTTERSGVVLVADEYTPTTEQVREGRASIAGFDRWFDEAVREAKAEGLETESRRYEHMASRLLSDEAIEAAARGALADDVAAGRYGAEWGDFPETDAWYISNARVALSAALEAITEGIES